MPFLIKAVAMSLANYIGIVGFGGYTAWRKLAGITAQPHCATQIGNVSLVGMCRELYGHRDWLWMFDPSTARRSQIADWHSADRYSLAEMAHLSDNDAFFRNRQAIRSAEIMKSFRKVFRFDSEFSAKWQLLIL